MQMMSVEGVKILGVYGCLPEVCLDNREALADLYEDGAENVIKATGIRQRYIAEAGTSSLDLCARAADALFQDLQMDRSLIGGLVSVTFTPHFLMPFNASLAQHRLGLPSGIPAFDINLACSGYAYGLWLAASIAKASQKPVLLLDGDVQSAFMSSYDLATVPVLADAGSATLVAPEGTDVWHFSFHTDGSRGDVLQIPAGGSALPITEAELLYTDYEDGSRRRPKDIAMDGFAVFKFVAQDVSKLLRQFAEELDHPEYSGFIPHQANMYMVQQLAKKLGFSAEQLWRSGDEYGNSASATVPMTIAKNALAMLAWQKQRVLVSGFGAGLSVSMADMFLYPDAAYRVVRYGKDS